MVARGHARHAPVTLDHCPRRPRPAAPPRVHATRSARSRAIDTPAPVVTGPSRSRRTTWPPPAVPRRALAALFTPAPRSQRDLRRSRGVATRCLASRPLLAARLSTAQPGVGSSGAPPSPAGELVSTGTPPARRAPASGPTPTCGAGAAQQCGVTPSSATFVRVRGPARPPVKQLAVGGLYGLGRLARSGPAPVLARHCVLATSISAAPNRRAANVTRRTLVAQPRPRQAPATLWSRTLREPCPSRLLCAPRAGAFCPPRPRRATAQYASSRSRAPLLHRVVGSKSAAAAALAAAQPPPQRGSGVCGLRSVTLRLLFAAGGAA